MDELVGTLCWPDGGTEFHLGEDSIAKFLGTKVKHLGTVVKAENMKSHVKITIRVDEDADMEQVKRIVGMSGSFSMRYIGSVEPIKGDEDV